MLRPPAPLSPSTDPPASASILTMQHTTFRRVLNSLSPKKSSESSKRPHFTPSPNKPHVSTPTNVTRITPSKSPLFSAEDQPARHPVTEIFEQESLPPDPSEAVEVQYERYIARISTRAQQRSATPPSPLTFDEPFAERNASRVHRRAMRDLTLDTTDLPPPGKENSNHNSLERSENAPVKRKDSVLHSHSATSDPARQTQRVSSLPPMYVDVDPRLHFHAFQPVGKGGSGSVYFATPYANPTSRVALKRVSPSTRAKSKALENEIRTMHALRHPNIVQCHEAYSFEGSVWIVMEAMDVGCLTHVLDFLRVKGYLLSESHIAYILRETLLGLWTMHSHRCMHRDIKSDNILVSSSGEIKLGDFEYTAVLTEDTPKRNTIVGTAWWMAPETVRSSYYDYGADVWSIGILSVECAEWVPPLFGMESGKAMEVIRSGATIQGFKRPDMWSVEFADFVRGCLTRDRSLRYTVPDLLRHPFLEKACSQVQIANVFRAVRGMGPVSE